MHVGGAVSCLSRQDVVERMIERYDCFSCKFWTARYEVAWPNGDVDMLCDDCYNYDEEDNEFRTESVRVLNNGMRTFVGGN